MSLPDDELCAHFKWLGYEARAELYRSYFQARRKGRIKKSAFTENTLQLIFHLKACSPCRGLGHQATITRVERGIAYSDCDLTTLPTSSRG